MSTGTETNHKFLPIHCSYCMTPFFFGQKIISCPECGAYYHTQCWQENGNRCAVLGCHGSDRNLLRQTIFTTHMKTPPVYVTSTDTQIKHSIEIQHYTGSRIRITDFRNSSGGSRNQEPYITVSIGESTVSIRESQATTMKNIKLLFLAANPIDTPRQRFDAECRAIEVALRQADFGYKFDIQTYWAVRTEDIQRHILYHKPDIIHFSGHGTETNEIILEDAYGHKVPIQSEVLCGLFSVLKEDVRCIVLSACYTDKQAQIIAEYIDCVIGMSDAIEDNSAINFAQAFYQALGFGKSVQKAFELGCIQIGFINPEQRNIPKLMAIKVDPEDITFISCG